MEKRYIEYYPLWHVICCYTLSYIEFYNFLCIIFHNFVLRLIVMQKVFFKKITSSYLSYAEGNTSYFNNAHSNGFRTHFLSPCMPFSFYVPLRFTARFLTSMRTFVLQFILVHFINVDCFVVFEFIGSYITIFSYLSYLCVRNSVFL